MKTFTLNNGNAYTQQDNGYCFAVIDGKKSRCIAAAFKMAHDQFVKEENERQNATNEFTNIDALIEKAEDSITTEEAYRIAKEMQVPAVLNEHGLVDCHDCPSKDTCIHYGSMRRNPTEVGGLGLCPRLKAKKKAAVDLEALATETATLIAEYQKTEDAAEREDSFETPEDVLYYVGRYGWYDEIDCDEDLSDDEMRELNDMITKKLISILFPDQPKAKKTRKPKDVAFATIIGDTNITLTGKQTDFIRHLSDTCFWEDGLDSCIWVDCLCDDIQGQFAGKPMTVGAMISTLCEKGLGIRATDRRDGRKCTSFELTELGKKVAAEVGLQ